ncbi:hypothetical protein ACW14Y_42915 [Kitasatospora sp. cg17-2]
MAPRYDHEPEHYTTGETLRLAALVLRAALKGGPTARIDRRIAEIQTAAVAREIDAAERRAARR